MLFGKSRVAYAMVLSVFLIISSFSAINLCQNRGDDSQPVFSDNACIASSGLLNVTYRLLAVERYFSNSAGTNYAMRSAQYLADALLNMKDYNQEPIFKNWQNGTWGWFNSINYTSYVHILSCDPDINTTNNHFGQRTRSSYRGIANKTNIINEIQNFLGATGPGEDNNYTVRIFYYCDHSSNDHYISDNDYENYLLVGSNPANNDDIITASELNQTMLSGDLQTNNCTVLIFDSCKCGGFTSSLYKPGRTILTAVNNDELAQSRMWVNGDPGTYIDWSVYTGQAIAYYAYANTTAHVFTREYFGNLGLIGTLENARWCINNAKTCTNDANSDGWLSIKEIYGYANSTMTDFIAKDDTPLSAQHPQFESGVFQGQVPIVMYRKTTTIEFEVAGHQTIITFQTIFPFNPPASTPWIGPYPPNDPEHRGDPGRTGFYQPLQTTGNLTITNDTSVVWSMYLPAPIRSTPVTDGGDVYYASSTSSGPTELRALGVKDGNVTWRFIAPGETFSSLAISEGKVFLGTRDPFSTEGGKLWALDEYTGSVIWNLTLGGHVASPAISEGMLIATTVSGTTSKAWALNVTTGEPIWNLTLIGRSFASPTVYEEKVFFASYEGNITAVEQSSGHQLWSTTIYPHQIFATPAAASGLLFVATLGNIAPPTSPMLMALTTTSGSPVWSDPFPTPLYSSPAVDYETEKVFACAQDGTFRAVNAASGSFLWENHIGPVNMSSPVVAKGGGGGEIIYVGSLDSKMYSLNETNGSVLGYFATGAPIESSPAMYGWHVMVGSMAGRVLCFGPEFPIYDIAIEGVKLSQTTVDSGQVVNVEVDVANQGNVPEVFNLICAHNDTNIWDPPTYLEPVTFSSDTIMLSPREKKTLTYQLNTAEMHVGTYSVYAYVPQVEFETNASNNAFKSPNLRIIGHDVAVSNVGPLKTVVCQTFSCPVNITVSNHGDFAETINVTLYAGLSSVASQNVTLASGSSTTITLKWNATGFACGNYTIEAYAKPVIGEVYESDNTLIDGNVTVSIQGDINGDRTVDIFDIVIIGLAFGATPNDPNWDFRADINSDNTIDIFDIVIIALHFGETGP